MGIQGILPKCKFTHFTEFTFNYGLELDKRDKTFMPTDGGIISFNQGVPIYADQASFYNRLSLSQYHLFTDNVIGVMKFHAATITAIDDYGCSADTTFNESFKVTREKTTTMFGTGVEYFEENITYFVKNYGIVKDDLEFRWNTPPGGSSEELDGKYRWEMISNNVPDSDCSDEIFLQTLIDRKKSINMDEFNQIDALNADPYKKTRTYGLQRVIDEVND